MKLLAPTRTQPPKRPRALQYATIRRALEDERITLPKGRMDRTQYIEQFLLEAKKLKDPASSFGHSRLKSKRPALRLMAVKRRNRWGMLSIDPRLYRLHCKVLGKERVQKLLNEIGPQIDYYMHSGHFSRRMREELIKRTKEVLRGKKALDTYREALRRILPPPPRVYVTVPVRRAKGQRPYTTVLLRPALYERARAIMGSKSFRAWITAASHMYEKDMLHRDEMSRSEYTRHVLRQQIYFLTLY